MDPFYGVRFFLLWALIPKPLTESVITSINYVQNIKEMVRLDFLLCCDLSALEVARSTQCYTCVII